MQMQVDDLKPGMRFVNSREVCGVWSKGPITVTSITDTAVHYTFARSHDDRQDSSLKTREMFQGWLSDHGTQLIDIKTVSEESSKALVLKVLPRKAVTNVE